MKLKTRLYITILAVITFPGVRELLVWLADRIFDTDFAPFYRLWINIAGGFVVTAAVVELIWEIWDLKYGDQSKLNQTKYTYKKD